MLVGVLLIIIYLRGVSFSSRVFNRHVLGLGPLCPICLVAINILGVGSLVTPRCVCVIGTELEAITVYGTFVPPKRPSKVTVFGSVATFLALAVLTRLRCANLVVTLVLDPFVTKRCKEATVRPLRTKVSILLGVNLRCSV